jgi:hypothetical protein
MKQLPKSPDPADAENIGPAERRVRVIMGAGSLVVGLVVLAVLVAKNTSRWWRILLFLPFYNAALGFFQAGERTCVMMAGQGFMKMGGRLEKVTDPGLDALLRRKSRKIFILSALAAAALTGLSLLVPEEW